MKKLVSTLNLEKKEWLKDVYKRQMRDYCKKEKYYGIIWTF